MSQGPQGSHCFATEDDVAKWLGESGRRWRQKVHCLDKEALRRMAVVLGVGQKQPPQKEKLAETVCEKAASLLVTAKRRSLPTAGQSTQSPVKKARSSASASSATAVATPEPAVKKSRWTPGCLGSPMPSADGPAATEGPGTPRSIRAAEALAMSTRKSEFGSPPGPQATPPAHRDVPSACDIWMTDHLSALLGAKGVRPNIKALVLELQELQGSSPSAVWPIQRSNKGLYLRLYRLRTDYKKALAGEIQNPSTIEDLRLLSRIVGGGGPRDQALGDGALGAIEHVRGCWRWAFKDVGSDVVGAWHDAEAAAAVDLQTVQLLLFPPSLPAEVWFVPTQRTAHLQGVKIEALKRRAHAFSAIGQQEPLLPTRLARPHDARTLSNDFPGFRNLGDTCYLNAVLQCIFHCEPLASSLFAPAQRPGVLETALRDLFEEYVASGDSTADVIAPVRVLQKVQQHAGFVPGRQQDAAECLRQLLLCTGLHRRFCDSQAPVADGGVVMSFAPEVAQISSAAGAIDAKALLLTAMADEGKLGIGAQVLVLRMETTYELGGEDFWVDAHVTWPDHSLTVTVANEAEPQVDYDVQAYLVHIPFDTDVSRGMRSGHYVAYFKHGSTWYEADDQKVTMLTEPPTKFPYVVLLARCDRGRPAHAAALRRRVQAVAEPEERLAQLPKPTRGVGPGEHSSETVQGKHRTGQGKRRTGLGEHRTGLGEHRAGLGAHRAGLGARSCETRNSTRANKDHPYKRFCENYGLYRKCPEVTVRQWEPRAEPSGPLPCLLCPPGTDFHRREDWLRHLVEEHGGRQRCRNAWLAHMQLAPHVVTGQEWRAIVGNFAEFFGRSATDWESFTPEMVAALFSEDGLRPEERWLPRQLAACVFCARSHWLEELHNVYIAGEQCFMAKPNTVWKMLEVSRYRERWPLIAATGELEASSVTVVAPDPKKKEGHDEYRVLLHKRRVTEEQAAGRSAVHVCADCKEAFEGPGPWLCKYALANDLWLGRWCPLFRKANLSHQMLLALARVVTTKIVLRPDGSKNKSSDCTGNWDFLFHQSGIIGTAILFQNADCGPALQQFPPPHIHDSFAVSFVAATTAGDPQAQAKEFVATKIAKLKVSRPEFDAQAAALTKSNVVYDKTTYDRDLVAKWVPDPAVAAVPPVIADAVVAVPLEESPGQVVAEGPGDATAAGEEDRMDADIAAAREARYIAAFEPETQDLNTKHSGAMEVTALMQQLEELDHAAQRSVALEIESAAEARLGDGACLVDHAGRERILELCEKIHKKCAKTLRDGEARATPAGTPEDRDWPTGAAASSSGTVPHLVQPRGAAPLSYWDWRIWTMARPHLWRFGDAANLYPDRETLLTLNEWMCCMLLREEMEYDMPTDTEPFRARGEASGPELNRFARDWITLHIFSSMRILASQQESTHAFLKNGGIAWARKVAGLKKEHLAEAARTGREGDDIRALAQNASTPQLVRDALNIMQMATAHVLGTDGHRRLCRHEGNAYTTLFGPPLEFCAPNLADGKQPCLLVVQNERFYLDGTRDHEGVLPKYRDMLLRLAKDPVGQTRVFHLMMRLFFQHVLGVRPECIESRRGTRRSDPREWCTDGMAASACAPGIFGPVAAFRGEIEAQGRGSLHPHILVWLALLSVGEVVDILRRDSEQFQRNLYRWMKATVAAAESISQSSVRSLPRRFGDLGTEVTPLGFSATERRLSRYDGESELSLLEAVPEGDRSAAQTKALQELDPEMWCRPCLPVRAPNGELLASTDAGDVVRVSIYTKRVSEFAVGQCPEYRRRGALKRTDPAPPDPQSRRSGAGLSAAAAAEDVGASQWEHKFFKDVRSLAQEVFVHICGESCHKYSGKKKVQQICRHGFYHIVNLGTWDQRKEGISFRRRGKALRNQMFVTKCTQHGMQGRLLMFQEHPFEVPTNYAGAASVRCNLDVQDLRRVLPESLWNPEGEACPALPVDEARAKEFGYMGAYEWDGEGFAERARDASACGPTQWANDQTREEWHQAFLTALAPDDAAQEVKPFQCQTCGAPHHANPSEDDHACACMECECMRAATAAFADAINTGFYVNSYTTKQCPTMEGVLENLRQGLERLEEQRAREQEELERGRARDAELVGKEAAMKVHKGKSTFAETMRTLNRLNSSYRRCYWKSGGEMIFPILYGHMTFASHRRWTVYVKKAVFQAAQAWRRLYGNSVRLAAIKAGGPRGLSLLSFWPDMDPYPLRGWRWDNVHGQRLLVGPQGQTCETTVEAFDMEMSTPTDGTSKALRQQLTMIQKFLNECCKEQ
ncbi:unnamed protein product, partial [Prorocentrum cordatum]